MVTITASVDKVNTQISVALTAGAPSTVTISGGNNQAGAAGTTLPLPLTVVVADQYSNPVAGVNVGFNDGGVGGAFSNLNPIITNGSGAAAQMYRLPPKSGPVYINAAAVGVANPVLFTETSR